MSEATSTKMDNRVPIDKRKVLELFASLPYVMQISLLTGLSAGMAAANQTQ